MKNKTINISLVVILITAYASLAFAQYHNRVVSTLSIQNNIQDREGHYSWEQWCRYERADGTHDDVHLADFSVVSEGLHAKLTTNVCDRTRLK